MFSIYGLIIAFAILTSIFYAEIIVKKDKGDTQTLWDVSFCAVFFGLIGARFYHVIDYWSYYSLDPLSILYIWNGGMAIYGALAGGLVSCVIYLRYKKQQVSYWVDLAAQVLPLGQAIGRWGNYANQELFGPPTSLPWGIKIDQSKRPEQFISFEHFHPLFLYESILNLFLFLLLSKIRSGSKKYVKSTLIYFYLMGYSTIRFFLEFLRIESWRINGFNVAQIISVVIFILALLSVLHISQKQPFKLATG